MMDLTPYHRAVAFLESLPGLEPGRPPGRGVGSGRDRRAAALMEALGHPERGPRFIHIGGTSGKGSTVAMVHRAYAAVGAPVFSFTSPHLVTTLERFAFRGGLCPLPVFLEAVEELKAACLTLHRRPEVGAPSYFDAVFALALIAARRLKADPVVLEVGLGGRLDGTNLIPPPVVAAVTEVGLDHMHILGSTIAEIARDKGGIFKAGSRALSGARRPEARRVLEEEARKGPGALALVDRDFALTEGGAAFEWGPRRWDLPPALAQAPYAPRNLATALAILMAGGEGGLPFDAEAMAEALVDPFQAGRFEIVEEAPPIVLDVAHNPDKLKAFGEAFSARYGREGVALFGLARDKDLEGCLRALAPHVGAIIASRTLLTHRGTWSPREILAAARGLIPEGHLTLDPWGALALGRALGRPLAITGSTYLAGELRTHWQREEEILRRGGAGPVRS